MSMAELVVTAVKVQGRTKSEVARDYALSRRGVHELVTRFETESGAGLAPLSRRPHTSPRAMSRDLEDQIVEIRKKPTGHGLDAGAETIAAYLSRRTPSFAENAPTRSSSARPSAVVREVGVTVETTKFLASRAR